jgi:hypothetical protein
MTKVVNDNNGGMHFVDPKKKTDCEKHGPGQDMFVSVFVRDNTVVRGCYKCILEWEPEKHIDTSSLS